jgi:isocitrate dehydrogenase
MTGKLINIVFLFITFSSCVIADEESKRKVTIAINPASASEVDRLSSTAFGISLANWVQENENIDTLSDGVFKPSFQALYSAFNRQITIWNELSENDPKKSIYMDDLVKVYNSGFMKEYIWTYHKDTDWKNVDELKMDEFEAWANQNISEHKPRLEARLKLSW